MKTKFYSKVGKEENIYPKLMKSTESGSIYLMISRNRGTKLTIGDDDVTGCDIGHCDGFWDEDVFVDFNGAVEMMNI